MKKFFLIIISFIIVLCLIIYFGFNLICKELLEKKLSEINGAPVRIEKADISLKEGKMTLKNIKINSAFDKDYTFVLIPSFTAYYELYAEKKLIVFEDAEINGIEFYFKEKSKEKDEIEFFDDKIKNSTKSYNEDKVLISLKDNYFSKLNFNLDTLDSKKSNIFKYVDKKVSEIKERYLDNYGPVFVEENENKKIISQFINENRVVLEELDKYLSLYITSLYEETLYKKINFCRNIVEELKKRQETENENYWELYFKNMTFNTTLYGINFYGEVKDFSSNISKNIKNLNFKFFGEKNENIGEFRGYFNFNNLKSESELSIPEFDLSQHGYDLIKNGEAQMYQYIVIDDDYLSIDGKLHFKNLVINENKFLEKFKLNNENEIVKEFATSIFGNIRTGNIEYYYDTETRKLKVKSDISNSVQKYLDKNKNELIEKLQKKLN